MKILVVRTDNPEAEIGIFDDHKKLAYETWQAHRQLAETIHKKILDLLLSLSLDWKNIGGIVIYSGPGSFTGLRIGFSVTNTLAYSISIPIASATGDNWIEAGIGTITSGKGHKIVMPEYGMPVHITEQKK